MPQGNTLHQPTKSKSEGKKEEKWGKYWEKIVARNVLHSICIAFTYNVSFFSCLYVLSLVTLIKFYLLFFVFIEIAQVPFSSTEFFLVPDSPCIFSSQSVPSFLSLLFQVIIYSLTVLYLLQCICLYCFLFIIWIFLPQRQPSSLVVMHIDNSCFQKFPFLCFRFPYLFSFLSSSSSSFSFTLLYFVCFNASLLFASPLHGVLFFLLACSSSYSLSSLPYLASLSVLYYSWFSQLAIIPFLSGIFISFTSIIVTIVFFLLISSPLHHHHNL